MNTLAELDKLSPSRELTTSPSSKLKNAFKSVFQRVLEEGPLSITRNRKREAILLSVELYDQMVDALAA
ncbi:MAG: type II toxin-antitoxin system prevent-host-death family antitoxin [Verrucomicrobiota bacterium]